MYIMVKITTLLCLYLFKYEIGSQSNANTRKFDREVNPSNCTDICTVNTYGESSHLPYSDKVPISLDQT